MMYLQFSDLDSVALAITSGVIPEGVATAAARAAVESGRVLIAASPNLGPTELEQLASWGITTSDTNPAKPLRNYGSWFELFPLEPTGLPSQADDTKAVLFEVCDESQFPGIVNEILRQGNDRQSFRYVEVNGERRLLLRVLGPPYYSLLRSQDSGQTRAFVEAQARVWVQVGYRHRFQEQLVPAPGQHLLLGAPDEWRVFAEHTFKDIYHAARFRLGKQQVEIQNIETNMRLNVPLRMCRGSTDDPPELFVIRNNAIRQLDEFVGSASDEVLKRLAFVVTEPTESIPEPIVVIRVRPGRTPAPVLVFDALAYRRYLKIPNLFVPVGQRIHPPLRREAIRDLLAADEANIVWLEPEPGDDTRRSIGFTPTHVRETQFRPLSDWIDYTIERDVEHVRLWQSSHVFEFQSFICKDSKAPRKPDAKTRQPSANEGPDTRSSSETAPKPKRIRKFSRPKRSQADPELAVLEQRLRELESSFLALDSPLDDPARESIWREMGEVNFELDRFTDSAICRQHELWEQSLPDGDSLSAWFESEVTAAARAQSRTLCDGDGKVDERRLCGWVESRNVPSNEVTQLATWLVGATRRDEDSGVILKHRGAIQKYLEQHESILGVRLCWLAWAGLAQLIGDELMLARARDRVLNRLYQNGLARDRDLPAFLRISGSDNDRFRMVRDRVNELHHYVREWSGANLKLASSHTLSYIDLVFAFGFARLGETSTAADLMRDAQRDLPYRSDPVHSWLLTAFSHRIQQVTSGDSADSPFPRRMLKKLEKFSKLDRYKVDRLREHSSILEPNERLDPYREWRRTTEGDLSHDLATLFDIISREELGDRLRTLFKTKMSAPDKSLLVSRALELSTRLGEKFALKMLEHVIPLCSKLDDTMLQADLLSRGLTIAAHYDEQQHAEDFLSRLHALITATSNDVETLKTLEQMLSRTFTSLRRLGMRDEAALLLERMTDCVRTTNRVEIEPDRLRVLLQLAGGWFYFGSDRGWPDIDTAREMLLFDDNESVGQIGSQIRTNLAVSYIQAVGNAPLEQAMDRLMELFTQLEGIHDAATVNTHYSLKQLDIVDALIATIVSDSFTADKESQRWLDDEEFLIRRRIHKDLRAMLNQ